MTASAVEWLKGTTCCCLVDCVPRLLWGLSSEQV